MSDELCPNYALVISVSSVGSCSKSFVTNQSRSHVYKQLYEIFAPCKEVISRSVAESIHSPLRALCLSAKLPCVWPTTGS